MRVTFGAVPRPTGHDAARNDRAQTKAHSFSRRRNAIRCVSALASKEANQMTQNRPRGSCEAGRNAMPRTFAKGGSGNQVGHIFGGED